MSTFIERHAQWLRERDAFLTMPQSVRRREELANRGLELLSEAMSRLSLARMSLEHIARNWIAEPFPSITCSEADSLYMAMSHVGLPDELGDEFMTHHAYTDEDDDAHIVVVDETGTPVGWEQRANIEDDEPVSPFEAVGFVFYDPVTDSLATDDG